MLQTSRFFMKIFQDFREKIIASCHQLRRRYLGTKNSYSKNNYTIEFLRTRRRRLYQFYIATTKFTQSKKHENFRKNYQTF